MVQLWVEYNYRRKMRELLMACADGDVRDLGLYAALITRLG